MSTPKLILFVSFLLFDFFHLRAQEKLKISFGKISIADFDQSAPVFDPGANAVVISDIGSNKFVKNGDNSFSMVYTRFMRVKIMNKNGFDIGSHEIFLSQNSRRMAERLVSLKGSTYNLENGVISETKLDETSIYSQEFVNNVGIRKFSMPALRAGSIYDLEYTIRSPFYDIEMRPWTFQGRYPCLWSEYEVTIAAPFHYVISFQGDEHFDIDTKKEISETYTRREPNEFSNYDVAATNRYNEGSVSAKSLNRRWVKKNVPALYEEPFTTTLKNYNSRVSFQLEYVQWPGSDDNNKVNYLPTWNYLCHVFYKFEGFGLAINHDNNWLYDDLKQITRGDTTDEQKVRHIYRFVRDNMKTTTRDGLFVHGSLKDVFIKKEGNVAAVNLLLTTMIQRAGIQAEPLILSTRENGIANPVYPMISEYNYVICAVVLGSREIFLDASQPYEGFGQLPVKCYNGYGHIIDEENSIPVYLSADSIRENKISKVIIFSDDKGNSSGIFTSRLGVGESYNVRNEIGNSSQKKYEDKIQNRDGSDVVLQNFDIDSLKNYDFPLTVHFEFDLKNISGTDILYFNPMLGEGYKENPFKSVVRHYPVEMPYPLDETYILSMDIPVGYQIDEIPKSARVLYNDNEGYFEYMIEKGMGNLQLSVHLKLQKAFFPVEDYAALRDFFTLVVKKESEQIVFKKIK